jgi:hypothetical protein
MNSDQDHGSILLPDCRLSPFSDEDEDVQFQQVIVAAVFCRAMLELKTISAAMCNEIGCICGISANS